MSQLKAFPRVGDVAYPSNDAAFQVLHIEAFLLKLCCQLSASESCRAAKEAFSAAVPGFDQTAIVIY